MVKNIKRSIYHGQASGGDSRSAVEPCKSISELLVSIGKVRSFPKKCLSFGKTLKKPDHSLVTKSHFPVSTLRTSFSRKASLRSPSCRPRGYCLHRLPAIVGRESDFKTTTTQRLFYLTSVKYQKKGLTTEAIRGFLKADDLNYDTLELSINPYNNSSIAIAKAIDALKVGEGYNSAGNQLRHFYAISTIQLLDKISHT